MFSKLCSLMMVRVKSRDGGIGRRVGLRIQCPKGVQVQILFPAPAVAPDSHRPAKMAPQAKRQTSAAKAEPFFAACGTTQVVPFPKVALARESCPSLKLRSPRD